MRLRRPHVAAILSIPSQPEAWIGIYSNRVAINLGWLKKILTDGRAKESSHTCSEGDDGEQQDREKKPKPKPKPRPSSSPM